MEDRQNKPERKYSFLVWITLLGLVLGGVLCRIFLFPGESGEELEAVPVEIVEEEPEEENEDKLILDQLSLENELLRSEIENLKVSGKTYLRDQDLIERRKNDIGHLSVLFTPSVYTTAEWHRSIEAETTYDRTIKEYLAAKQFNNSFPYDMPWDNVLFIGDSITAAVSGNPDNFLINTYPETVARIFGVESYYIDAVGGSGYSKDGWAPFYDRTTEYHFNPDVVFVFGGINDAFLMEAYDGVLDSENLIDRIQADIREYYEYLNNTYRKADIYIVIPYELLLANMYGEDVHEEYLTSVFNVIRNVASEFNFYQIDLSDSGFLDLKDLSCYEYFMTDVVHPNGYGYQMLGEFIAAEALRLKIGSENGMEGYEQSHED